MLEKVRKLLEKCHVMDVLNYIKNKYAQSRFNRDTIASLESIIERNGGVGGFTEAREGSLCPMIFSKCVSENCIDLIFCKLKKPQKT